MNQPPRYQPQNGREAMETGGFVGDWYGGAPVAPIGTNQIFEPSPIAGGSNKGNCSSGFMWTVFNVVAHVITLVLTMVAAAANYHADKHKRMLCVWARYGPKGEIGACDKFPEGS